MSYEYAVYYKLLLLCGYADELCAYVDTALAEENPLADIVLELSTVGNDRNTALSVLNDYLRQVEDADIDYAAVFSLVLEFLNRQHSGGMSMESLTNLMYRLAICTERYEDEPWQTDAQTGYIDKETYRQWFVSFMRGEVCSWTPLHPRNTLGNTLHRCWSRVRRLFVPG